MEFNKTIYDDQLANVVSSIYSTIQKHLQTPEWVGTICSLDIIPSNGQLYPLELNTNILLTTEFINEWNLTPFIEYLVENGYDRVIFRRDSSLTEEDEVTNYLRSRLSLSNIDLVEVREKVKWYTYERERATDFILQHRWNYNFLDELAADKKLFFNFLTANNVGVNKQVSLTQEEASTIEYDYNASAPSFFYKIPNKDTGLGVDPVIVDSDTSVDNNFYRGIENDTYFNTRVEISKRSIVGSNFIIDYDYPDSHYVYLPKYTKCDPYITSIIDANVNRVRSNFVKSNKTKICQNFTFIEGNRLELTDGSFKEVSEITQLDKIKFYKFNGFDSLNYEYYLDNQNYQERKLTEYTWVGQNEWLSDFIFKDTTLYEPVSIDIKFKVTGKVSSKITINNEYDFIKNKNIVFKDPQNGFFRHNYVQKMKENSELVKVDGSTYQVTSYQESLGDFNAYSFITNEYDLYNPYFVNMNGIFVLVY